jgi:hypothetical protein
VEKIDRGEHLLFIGKSLTLILATQKLDPIIKTSATVKHTAESGWGVFARTLD